ncbi:MAG: EF-P lysine aminoacylase GenX [Candidatus Magasanikbacteria bacterium]|nr:EF-P lysine aminoacylase GenX [Candidatus Magasanikbacteria bacterium]
MSHITHIAQHKKQLELRFEIIRAMREFFWSKNFLEVETPLVLKHPGMEPNLSAMKVDFHNEHRESFTAYLHTSPEYTMKKMLASGFGNIFSLTKCFRDEESFGGMHNPEFTMVEWYSVGADLFRLMREVEKMIGFVVKKIEKLEAGSWKREFVFTKVSMKELWLEILNVDLDEYLTTEKMFELCREKGYSVSEDEQYEGLFYRIFLDEIEPRLATMGGVMIYLYPAPMASLSKKSVEHPGYAERVEVYVDGVELANGFSELTHADEQLKRLQEEQAERKLQGKTRYEIDMEFIDALNTMPECAGIALGVDRLVQVVLSCKNIDDVLVLPASKLFEN